MNEYVENFDELISLGTPIFVVAMMLSLSSAVPWSPAPGGSLLLRLIVIARRTASPILRAADGKNVSAELFLFGLRNGGKWQVAGQWPVDTYHNGSETDTIESISNR